MYINVIFFCFCSHRYYLHTCYVLSMIHYRVKIMDKKNFNTADMLSIPIMQRGKIR